MIFCNAVLHNNSQGHQEFPPETIESFIKKNQTKWPIELWTDILEAYNKIHNLQFFKCWQKYLGLGIELLKLKLFSSYLFRS